MAAIGSSDMGMKRNWQKHQSNECANGIFRMTMKVERESTLNNGGIFGAKNIVSLLIVSTGSNRTQVAPFLINCNVVNGGVGKALRDNGCIPVCFTPLLAIWRNSNHPAELFFNGSGQ